MLDHALIFFQEQLNNYIRIKTGGQREDVVRFVEIQPPKEVTLASNAINMLLVNVEEERIFRSGAAYASNSPNGASGSANPNLCLNLHLMFIANFKEYVEGLRVLSLVLKFFRSYRLFDQRKFPSLNAEIEQLSTELVNLSFMEQGELWRSLEIPCSPSALYKVRMIVFQDEDMDEIETGRELGDVQTLTAQL